MHVTHLCYWLYNRHNESLDSLPVSLHVLNHLCLKRDLNAYHIKV